MYLWLSPLYIACLYIALTYGCMNLLRLFKAQNVFDHDYNIYLIYTILMFTYWKL